MPQNENFALPSSSTSGTSYLDILRQRSHVVMKMLKA
jgi:hypothetical protein